MLNELWGGSHANTLIIQDGGESSDGSLEVEEGDPQEEIPEPEEPVLTEEEIQQKQMRSYLGGLIPAVDQNILPSYLRSTSDTQGGYVMDLIYTREAANQSYATRTWNSSGTYPAREDWHWKI